MLSFATTRSSTRKRKLCNNESNKEDSDKKNTTKNDPKKNDDDNTKKNDDLAKEINKELDEFFKAVLHQPSLKRQITSTDNQPPPKKHKTEPCPNPLCDHKDYTKKEKKQLSTKDPDLPHPVNNINDLINIGKLYHCKKNKVYHGVNLKILCRMVKSLSELQNMVGLNDVKESIVNQIVFFLQGFNQKEKCNNCIDCTYSLPCSQNMNDDMLHTVITGPPGVGKTELGKILGHMYKSMGVLSKGHMIIARRSDLIGKYLGHTADKTQKVIDSAKGGVLFIDEAYSLGNKEGRDSFSKECIDTINQNLTENRDMLCIIAGYKDKLNSCFFAYNPGLERRFPFRYNIHGYSAEEIMEIFLLKIKKENWRCELDTLDIMDNVERTSIRDKLITLFKDNKTEFPHFGGDVETFFLNCKIHHGRRQLFKNPANNKLLTYDDIEGGLNKFILNKDKKIDIEGDYMKEYIQNTMYT